MTAQTDNIRLVDDKRGTVTDNGHNILSKSEIVAEKIIFDHTYNTYNDIIGRILIAISQLYSVRPLIDTYSSFNNVYGSQLEIVKNMINDRDTSIIIDVISMTKRKHRDVTIKNIARR